MMETALVEIREYLGTGYKPLIDFGAWRVAILRWEASMQPERQQYMERHNQTDEVFVLLGGQATLIIGGNGQVVDGFQVQAMECGKLYNVKLNTWHTVLLSRDASILIVENCDTGEANTEYWMFTPEQRGMFLDLGGSIDES